MIGRLILVLAVLAGCRGEALAQSSAFEQAAAAERNGRVHEAMRLYTEAAKAGDGKAAFRLGEIYEKGLGVKPNRELSLRWYNAAKTLGYPPPVGDFPDRKRSKDAGRLVP